MYCFTMSCYFVSGKPLISNTSYVNLPWAKNYWNFYFLQQIFNIKDRTSKLNLDENFTEASVGC